MSLPCPFFLSNRLLSLALAVLGLVWLGTGQPSASALSPSQSGRPIDIRAEQQTYNANTGESTFLGKVRLNYDNVEILSRRATVKMGSKGGAGLATFHDRPLVKHRVPNKGEDVLEADWVDIDLGGTSFKARGNTISTLATVAAMPINVRADVQQYDSPTGLISASGNVTVKFNDTTITSGKALVRMGPGGQADRVVFMGGAHLTQQATDIRGERITIVMANNNLVAEGGVKTIVGVPDSGGKVHLSSSVQQFDNVANMVLASGQVKLLYEDYIATGPKATFRMKPQGSTKTIDRIVMTGRPTIIDSERKITANQIIITPNPKKFDATGNVQTAFKSRQASAPPPGAPSASAKAPAKNGKASTGKSGAGPAKATPALPVTEEDELRTSGDQ